MTFGGTAPKVTSYWPPTMPELTEEIDENALKLVPRSEYNLFWKKNKGLRVMPRHMRMEMEALPCDEFSIVPILAK